jgi:elongation factor 1-beta
MSFSLSVALVMFKFSTVAALNEYLADRSFITGFAPSANDAAIAKTLTLEQVAEFPNVARWMSNILSYTLVEMSAFPGEVTVFEAAKSAAEPAAEAADEAEEDDDMDLFGSDDDDEWEAEMEKRAKEAQDRIDARNAAKGKDTAGKSMIVLDIKVWDDTIDLDALAKAVANIELNGCTWGEPKKVAVAFGMFKLSQPVVVVDDLCGVDDLEGAIMELEDLVQSVDVVSFNKL